MSSACWLHWLFHSRLYNTILSPLFQTKDPNPRYSFCKTIEIVGRWGRRFVCQEVPSWSCVRDRPQCWNIYLDLYRWIVVGWSGLKQKHSGRERWGRRDNLESIEHEYSMREYVSIVVHYLLNITIKTRIYYSLWFHLILPDSLSPILQFLLGWKRKTHPLHPPFDLHNNNHPDCEAVVDKKAVPNSIWFPKRQEY